MTTIVISSKIRSKVKCFQAHCWTVGEPVSANYDHKELLRDFCLTLHIYLLPKTVTRLAFVHFPDKQFPSPFTESARTLPGTVGLIDWVENCPVFNQRDAEPTLTIDIKCDISAVLGLEVTFVMLPAEWLCGKIQQTKLWKSIKEYVNLCTCSLNYIYSKQNPTYKISVNSIRTVRHHQGVNQRTSPMSEKF